MRNPIHFVVAIRNLAALANVAILAVEWFAVSLKPEMSHLCLAGTSRFARQWRHRTHAHALGDRRGYAISPFRYSDLGYSGTCNGQMPTRRCDAQPG